MLSVENTVFEKTLRNGTRREVMYYTESIRASYALYIVHDVDVGWERSEPIV